MESADLAAGHDLEADVHCSNAEKTHSLIHIVVPSRADGIGDSFTIATQRCGLSGSGGATAIGDIAADHGLTCFRLVSLGASLRSRYGSLTGRGYGRWIVGCLCFLFRAY